ARRPAARPHCPTPRRGRGRAASQETSPRPQPAAGVNRDPARNGTRSGKTIVAARPRAAVTGMPVQLPRYQTTPPLPHCTVKVSACWETRSRALNLRLRTRFRTETDADAAGRVPDDPFAGDTCKLQAAHALALAVFRHAEQVGAVLAFLAGRAGVHPDQALPE